MKFICEGQFTVKFKSIANDDEITKEDVLPNEQIKEVLIETINEEFKDVFNEIEISGIEVDMKFEE